MAPFITLFEVALSVDAILVHSNMEATKQVFLSRCLRCQFFLTGILENMLFRHFRTYGAKGLIQANINQHHLKTLLMIVFLNLVVL